MPITSLSRQLEEALRGPSESSRQEAIVHVLSGALQEIASLHVRVSDLEKRLETISAEPKPVSPSGPALRG